MTSRQVKIAIVDKGFMAWVIGRSRGPVPLAGGDTKPEK
jgi:hypothetical protein